MTDEGGRWISVPVEILQPGHPLHPRDQGEEACRLGAWIDLVGKAHWKAGNGFERGELEASVRFLANRWGWGRSRVQRFLDELEEQGEIVRETQTGRKPGRIKVCDYGRFAGPRDTNRDANRDSGDGVRRERVQKTGQSAGRSSAGGEGLLSEVRDGPRDAERDASEDKAVPVPREETDTEDEDSSLWSSSSSPQGGDDGRPDQEDGESFDPASWLDRLQDVDSPFASDALPRGVYHLLWRAKPPPPDAPGNDWSMGGDTRRLKNRLDQGWTPFEVGLAMIGLHLLGEEGEIPSRLTSAYPEGSSEWEGPELWHRARNRGRAWLGGQSDPSETLDHLEEQGIDLSDIRDEEAEDGR